MIRDSSFNPVFAVQPAPWGATIVKTGGYLIPLSAVKEDFPSPGIKGRLEKPVEKSPGQRLEDFCHGETLVQGTWYNLPEAMNIAQKQGLEDFRPLPPYVDHVSIGGTTFPGLTAVHIDDLEEDPFLDNEEEWDGGSTQHGRGRSHLQGDPSPSTGKKGDAPSMLYGLGQNRGPSLLALGREKFEELLNATVSEFEEQSQGYTT